MTREVIYGRRFISILAEHVPSSTRGHDSCVTAAETTLFAKALFGPPQTSLAGYEVIKYEQGALLS